MAGVVSAGRPVMNLRPAGTGEDDGGPCIDLLGVPGGDQRYWLLRVHRADSSRRSDFWKDEMISMVSHEIKNPLAAMKNSVDLLLSQAPGELTDGQKQFLDTSGRSIDRLNRLVDGFLDVSRIRAGAFEVERSATNIRCFVDDAMHSFQTLFNVTRVSLDWSIETEITDAHIDAPKLEQVLLNLLSNALKFTPENGEIDVTARTVGIEALDDTMRLLPWPEFGRPRILEITVRDNGIGMSVDTMDNVFDRFGSGRNDVKGQAPRGIHLGLNISRALVEAQGGWLDIESELGIGTSVTVRIPQDRRTLTTLSRLRQAEHLVRACVETRRPATVYVLGKYNDDGWEDIAASWQERAAINPSGVSPESRLYVWTLSNESAVAVLLEPGQDDVEALFGPNFVVCEDDAFVFQSYAVGAAACPGEARRIAQLLGIGTARMVRARDLMARATIEAMDSGIECITNEWTPEQ